MRISPPTSCTRAYGRTTPRERLQYGDPAILPTPVFFYGMEPGQEITVDLERGKTLIVRYVATSEPHDDGTRTVFFELNGQPRSVRVSDRSQIAKRAAPRKIEPGNAKHIGAPMPGVVTTVSATIGVKVARGEVVADARSHEDGNGGAGGERRRSRRGAGAPGSVGRCQGSAGGLELTTATAASANCTATAERPEQAARSCESQ